MFLEGKELTLYGELLGNSLGSHHESGMVCSVGMSPPVVNPTAAPVAPRPADCPQKRELAHEIKLAFNAIVAIHNEEFEAVMRGDYSTGEETQVRFREKRELKELVIERYRQHVDEHGC